MKNWTKSGESMKGKIPANGEKGTILIVTLIIITFLSILGMSLSAFLFTRQLSETNQIDRLQALYLAEAGIAKSIYELKFDTDLDGNGIGNINKHSLGRGTYQAEHDLQTLSIKAEGQVGDTTRVVQIKYRGI